MKITVITVCYNAEKKIKVTAESVLNQTYRNMEYIVKDGCSTDETVKILEELQSQYSFQVYSGKDNGIYDAMNIAAEYATGDYIIFLNAGDIFADNQVLEYLAQSWGGEVNADVLFGNVIYWKENGSRFIRKYSAVCAKKHYYLSGDTICHQAIMASRRSILKNPFDTRYSICADRDWLLRLIEQDATFEYLNKEISICEVEGYSTNNLQLYEQETKECIRRHFAKGYYLFCTIEMAKKSNIMRSIMRFCGNVFFRSRKVRKRKDENCDN